MASTTSSFLRLLLFDAETLSPTTVLYINTDSVGQGFEQITQWKASACLSVSGPPGAGITQNHLEASSLIGEALGWAGVIPRLSSYVLNRCSATLAYIGAWRDGSVV